MVTWDRRIELPTYEPTTITTLQETVALDRKQKINLQDLIHNTEMNCGYKASFATYKYRPITGYIYDSRVLLMQPGKTMYMGKANIHVDQVTLS